MPRSARALVNRVEQNGVLIHLMAAHLDEALTDRLDETTRG